MSRVQLALNVPDLDASIEFYSKLFETPPAKVRRDYANFAIAEPPLKLVLIEDRASRGSLNHLGVEVESTDEVAAQQARIEAEGAACDVGSRPPVASPCRTRCGSTARRSRGRSTPCSPTATTFGADRRPMPTTAARPTPLCCRVDARSRALLLIADDRTQPTAPSSVAAGVAARTTSTPREWTIDADRRRSATRSHRRRATARRSGPRPGDADSATTSRCRDSSDRDHRVVEDARATAVASCCSVGSRSTCSPTTESSSPTSASALHLGTPVSQDAAGELLGHVRDERSRESGPQVRLYRTRERQDFHTDGADIIGLLCLHGAKSGGESRIASSTPSTTRSCADAPTCSTSSTSRCAGTARRRAAGGQPCVRAGADHRRRRHSRASSTSAGTSATRNAIRTCPASPASSCEAMELLESIANDPAFHVEMDFEPGDVQLLNNGKILHSREAYEDDDDPAERRHLLRLWLAAHRFTSLERQLRERHLEPALSRPRWLVGRVHHFAWSGLFSLVGWLNVCVCVV